MGVAARLAAAERLTAAPAETAVHVKAMPPLAGGQRKRPPAETGGTATSPKMLAFRPRPTRAPTNEAAGILTASGQPWQVVPSPP